MNRIGEETGAQNMMSFVGRAIACIAILIALSASAGYAQQQFTQTVTAQNKNCNAGCSVIDVPEQRRLRLVDRAQVGLNTCAHTSLAY
jgi:hypothetical protein